MKKATHATNQRGSKPTLNEAKRAAARNMIAKEGVPSTYCTVHKTGTWVIRNGETGAIFPMGNPGIHSRVCTSFWGKGSWWFFVWYGKFFTYKGINLPSTTIHTHTKRKSMNSKNLAFPFSTSLNLVNCSKTEPGYHSN